MGKAIRVCMLCSKSSAGSAACRLCGDIADMCLACSASSMVSLCCKCLDDIATLKREGLLDALVADAVSVSGGAGLVMLRSKSLKKGGPR